MQVLEEAAAQRIEGTQVDERNDNKMWLVRYLEVPQQYRNVCCVAWWTVLSLPHVLMAPLVQRT
jgi:hypothetical protein